MSRIKLLFVCFLTVILAACEGTLPYLDARGNPFISTNHKATDALISSVNAGTHPLAPDATLLVATLVNIDALNESSRLGRVIAEQVQARLSQRGYAVVELKLRDDVIIQKDQGEFLLSRDVQEIKASHNAEAVVVGTYALAKNYAYVHLKVIGNDNIIIGAHDYTLPLDANIREMLKSRES